MDAVAFKILVTGRIIEKCDSRVESHRSVHRKLEDVFRIRCDTDLPIKGNPMELAARDFHELKELEERLWLTEFRSDRHWMDSILASEFFEFGQSGRVYTRANILDMVGGTLNATLPLTDFQVHRLSLDVFQVTYKSILTYAKTVQHANRSSIWIKAESGWKLTFHQGTPTTGT